MYECMQLAVRKTKIYYNSSCLKYCTPGPQQSYETPNVSTGILITTAYSCCFIHFYIYDGNKFCMCIVYGKRNATATFRTYFSTPSGKRLTLARKPGPPASLSTCTVASSDIVKLDTRSPLELPSLHR